MHRQASKPLVFVAAVSGYLASIPSSTHLDNDESTVDDRRRQGTVGVWLDASSRETLKKLFPKLADVRVVLLQSPDFVGTNVYEPLYGAVSSVKVLGSASSSTTEALTAQVSLPGLGDVESVGLPAPVIGGAAAADLIQRLGSLGVMAPSSSSFSSEFSWCGMVPTPTGGAGGKELLEFKRRLRSSEASAGSGPPPGLELSGIVCPSGLYEEKTHSCSWDPSSSSDSSSSEGGEDGGALSECPLCAFIKAGGCKEEFLPFQACLEASADEQAEQKAKTGVDGGGRDCMHLFGPVVECMQSTAERREYYKSFIEDFAHLFQKK